MERTRPNISIFPKLPQSSPSNSPFKTYSSPSSVKSKKTDSYEIQSEKSEIPEPSESEKSSMSDAREEAEKTFREWVTQEVNQKHLSITFPE